MGLNIGLVGLLVVAIFYAGHYAQTADTEIWNGAVTGKEKEWTSCEHSYSCNCRESCSGSGKDRSCSEVCDTCYEHSNDWNWKVRTTIGNFNISRIDSRGSKEPPRWSKVASGQPVAFEKPYVNYIKAVPESLFHFNSSLKEQHEKLLVRYPRVFDYHYANRVIPVGVTLPDIEAWNYELALMLRELGPKKQANIVLIVVKTPDQGYAHAIEAHWLGGKKNDVVVVLGVPEYPNIGWAYIMSWTDSQIFKVQLRDALLALGTVEKDAVLRTIHQHVATTFVRKPMADFAYLKDEIRPPTWVIVFAAMFGILGSIGLSFLFRQKDVNLTLGK
ncbi:MAG TPA: hypothetical protein VJH33_01030 [Candidatus Paceibacterota bacterium]